MRKLPAILSLLALSASAVVSTSSCSQTPTNVPIRTFEGAEKVAVVCLQVLDLTTLGPLPMGSGTMGTGSIPVSMDHCGPVAPGAVPQALPYHLIAAVTQTTRGELAIVDLTGGYVVDEDHSTPGINFIPVGTNPSDVAIPADGAWTYVASASPTKPAIYAINSTRLLGDSTAVNDPEVPPLQLTDLPVCQLPAPPAALALATVPEGAGADGGVVPTADGGVVTAADGGVVPAPDGGVVPSTYAIVALLAGSPPSIVTIDPNSVTQSGPGSLKACKITSTIQLSTELPSHWLPGIPWPNGVPYVDGGIDLTGELPPLGPTAVCSTTSDGGLGTVPPVDAGALADAGAALPDAGLPDAGEAADAGLGTEDGGRDGAVEDAAFDDAPGEDDAGPVVTEVPEASTPIAMAVDAGSTDAGFPFTLAAGTTPLAPTTPMVLRDDVHALYVADPSLPLIHVIDLSDPSNPKELEPLLATSIAQPTRQVQVGSLALSPPTRDYKRYLYAIDQVPGSLMVFDVTDVVASSHVPMLRPNSQLNPLAPIDRLSFAGTVKTMAFAQHDWPLQVPEGSNTLPNVSLAYQGLLCNPNPAAHPAAATFNDLGAYYRVDQAGVIQPNATADNFPTRLRGVFALVTLTNGTVVTVDVDDWDSPCRRPDPMADGGITGYLDVPQPMAAAMATDGGPGPDLNPYSTPLAYQGAEVNPYIPASSFVQPTSPSLSESPPVTLESFFPVSAPNRMRSGFLLRNDPTSGNHVPNLVAVPQLVDFNGTPVAASGSAAVIQPVLLATVLPPGFTDPSLTQNPTEPNPSSRMFLAPLATFPDPTASPTPAVRLSFDDPTVQENQDWTIAYEGVLPSSPNILADINSTQPVTAANAYTTLTFQTTGANLCGLGIEDWSLGQARANQALEDMQSTPGVASPLSPEQKSLPQWTSDYVEITDDILPSGDAYWGQANSCWAGIKGVNPDGTPDTSLEGTGEPGSAVASNRYNFCQSAFGVPGISANPDQNVARDAPILEAYADHMTVGRFGFPQGASETTANRTIDPGSANNPQLLKPIACCFHNQARFKVRAGGEWIAVGQQGVGFLNHVVASPGPAGQNRCVLSCNPQDALLNARSFDVPWSTTANGCLPPMVPASIGRNDGLALRNPMFSYVTWAGCGPLPSGAHTLTARDLTWKFTINGGFSPLTVALSGATGVSVSPQSMLYVGALGQMAVVDGSQQGLVLIDLNTVSFSTNYF